MPRVISLQINGQNQSCAADNVAQLLQLLALKADRIAVERNGEIVSRTQWEHTPVTNGDRIEIVHFVGGGMR
jgi:thiamine biosynthesis protein ThiS